MGFTKKQKIALIISLWLYFLWIVAICTTMRAQYKGKLLNCIIVGGAGCVLVLALYILAFCGAYYVSKKIRQKENIAQIKSIYHTVNIWAIYINIVGFFLLSLAVLLLDQSKMYSFRLALIIIVSSLFFVALVALFYFSYCRISSAIRTFALQEKNDGILKEENSQEK